MVRSPRLVCGTRIVIGTLTPGFYSLSVPVSLTLGFAKPGFNPRFYGKVHYHVRLHNNLMSNFCSFCADDRLTHTHTRTHTNRRKTIPASLSTSLMVIGRACERSVSGKKPLRAQTYLYNPAPFPFRDLPLRAPLQDPSFSATSAHHSTRFLARSAPIIQFRMSRTNGGKIRPSHAIYS